MLASHGRKWQDATKIIAKTMKSFILARKDFSYSAPYNKRQA
jgi:hypothetical protein